MGKLNLRAHIHILILSLVLILLAISIISFTSDGEAAHPAEQVVDGLGELLLFIIFTLGTILLVAFILYLLFYGNFSTGEEQVREESNENKVTNIVITSIIILALFGLFYTLLQMGQEEVKDHLEGISKIPESEKLYDEKPEYEPPDWLYPYLSFLLGIASLIIVGAVVIKIKHIIELKKINKSVQEEGDLSRDDLQATTCKEQVPNRVDLTDFDSLYAEISQETARNAIIKAYNFVIRYFQVQDIIIVKQLTPEENLRYIESALGLSRNNPVRSLTKSYLKARYSHHEISNLQKEEALESFQKIPDLMKGNFNKKGVSKENDGD
ncbi:hypothetical protein [Natranaerobius thermophilus]|uniref:DUF4129 domain-containing protein n=1 Tax=Natranaerobius thermophilus (strain ATCC BAA-1301 / DSM 18059 / JW/NM-WN-LF) TaxID=457570 RepID=B2A7G6_NATTJ|nr:hypothetical protein [Natranaerobius thermophilus]ACB85675.1 hypothetical protein Nther_2108 [Natranaerobius thermophilus JW/NM-WN-LF]